MSERMPIGRHIPYPAREMYYPAWAPSFEGLDDLEIKSEEGEQYYHGDKDEGGNDRPVTLRDVAPERRWAIDYDTGRVMNQRDFQELFWEWCAFKCTAEGVVVDLTKGNRHFDARSEPVPMVSEFVLRQPDGTQATWKTLVVQDFRPPAQAQNQELISQLVQGLGETLSGFAPRSGQAVTPQQEDTLGKPAEVRPKFEKVPAPSQGE